MPTIPGYEVLGELGRGGMGVVYKARQEKLNRLVAVKMVPGPSGAQLVRFLAEVEAVAAITHPHVVQVYEYGEHVGSPYLVMEYLSGGSLADWLRATGPLDVASAVELVRKLAGGVQAAHDQGIVHRDLKPGNVLLSRGTGVPSCPDTEEDRRGHLSHDLIPKITDFGLAKQTRHDLTRSGAIVGTPAYMAPEQARGRTKLTGPAADVYALGVILFECLTGTTPFTADDPVELILKVAQEPPPSVRSRATGVPRDLDLICRKCLAKEPHERYSSANDLAADLARFAAGEPVTVRPPGVIEKVGKWARRRPWVAGLAAALAVSLVVGAALSTGLAVWATREADRARDEADRADAEADASRVLAERVKAQRDQARTALYAARARLIQLSWQEGRADRVLDLLRRQRPGKGESDPRGFEYCYFDRQARRGLWQVSAPGEPGSRHGIRFVYSCPDGTILFQERGTLFRVDGPGDTPRRVLSAAFATRIEISPDSSRIAGAVADEKGPPGRYQVRVFDRATGKELARCRAASLKFGKLYRLTFTPDGRLLIGAAEAGVHVWDTASGEEVATFRGHRSFVWDAAVGPRGDRVVTAAYDGTVKVWDPRTGRERLSLQGDLSGVFRIAWTPDGRRIVGLKSGGELTVWDAADGRDLWTSPLGAEVHGGLAVSPDSRRVAAVTRNEIIRVWDLDGGAELLALPGHAATVRALAFSRDGRRLVSGDDANVLRVWDSRGRNDQVDLIGHVGIVWRGAWHPDGRRLATAAADGTVRLWDAITGRERRRLAGFNHQARGVAFRPDGLVLAGGSLDRSVKLWDVASGKLLRSLVGHTHGVNALAWTKEGRFLLSVGQDLDTGTGELIGWDASTGRVIFRHASSRQKGTSLRLYLDLALRPGGAEAAVSVSDGAVLRWDVGAGKPGTALRVSDSTLHAVTYTPDGRRLAVVESAAVVLFDAATGERLGTFRGHAARTGAGATTACFSPDGRRLSTGAGDGSVRVWDTDSGEELLTLSDLGEPIRHVTFSPDGSRLAATTDNGKVRIYEGVVPAARDLRAREVYREVAARFDEWVRPDAVRNSLRTDPALPDDLRREALALVDRVIPASYRWLQEAIPPVVLSPGRPAAAYRRALRQAQELARLSPNDPAAVFFLGVAQCRAGLSREAVGTLGGLGRLPAERRRHLDSVALAFVALAQAQSGAAAEARRSLDELARVLDRDPAGRGQALKVRAEVLKILDRAKADYTEQP